MGRAVTASCEPAICGTNFLGTGTGPTLSGEAVGDTPSSDDEEPFAERVVPLRVGYHCSSRRFTRVCVTFTPSFYDPVVTCYRKECVPWRDTPWGIFVIV